MMRRGLNKITLRMTPHELEESQGSDIDVTNTDLLHQGKVPSIDLTSPKSQSGGTTLLPWSPTSLSRAKTAIVYKVRRLSTNQELYGKIIITSVRSMTP